LDGDTSYQGIWQKGNGKLPFLHFSALAGAHCPGAGECLSFCYSLKAWRYPYGFARQFINSVLLSTPGGRAAILASLDKKARAAVTVRLYVDGDFNSVETLDFWMTALHARPHIKAYGYSKSFRILLAYEGAWPENYVLNISSGHNSPAPIVEAVRALPIVRGNFIAAASVAAVKEERGGRVFVCPIKCGTCLKGAHACGQKAIAKDIIIGVH
jgi:hypothetical protein